MNQKYVLGMVANAPAEESRAALVPTPANIAAFLYQNQQAPEMLVCTLDYKMFLTAEYGQITKCPDAAFLAQLQTLMEAMRTGTRTPGELVTVPRKDIDYECPMPDWNYLSWDGYTDEKYQKLCSGEALLDYTLDEETLKMELQVGSYVYGDNLAVQMIRWEDGESEPWADLTVNLDGVRAKDHAFIDTNGLGEEIQSWIKKTGIAEPTGNFQRSGFCVYPEYRFNEARLRELDRAGYDQYAHRQQAREKSQPQRDNHERAR